MKVYLLILCVFSAATAMPSATDETCQIMKETFMKKIKPRVARDFVHLSSVKKSNFHSCDINNNRALEAAEFAGCLHPLVTESSKLGEEDLLLRLACFNKFKRQADKNEDDLVTKEEFDNWTKLGFFDILLAASEQASAIEGQGITSVDVIIEETPAESRQVKEVAKIIKALVKGDTGQAIVRVYALLTGADPNSFDPLLTLSANNALAAISAGDIPKAIGNVFSIVAGILIRGDPTIPVTQATLYAVGNLLTAIISQNNQTGYLTPFIATAVSGVLVDFTAISASTGLAIGTIVGSAVAGTYDFSNTDALIGSLSLGLAEGIGISSVARDSLIALIKAIRDNNQEMILSNVFVVISAIAGTASGLGEGVATSLTLIIQSLVQGNTNEAVLHTANLYNFLSGGTCSTSKLASIFG